MQSCVSPPPTETTWCCRNLLPRPCSGVTHPRGPRSTSPCRGRRSRKPQRWRTEKVEWDHIAKCWVQGPRNSWTQVQEEPQCTMELCINDVKNSHATCIYCLKNFIVFVFYITQSNNQWNQQSKRSVKTNIFGHVVIFNLREQKNTEFRTPFDRVEDLSWFISVCADSIFDPDVPCWLSIFSKDKKTNRKMSTFILFFNPH